MMKWYWLSVLVVALDQVSKLIADSQLVFHRAMMVFPGFNFTLMYNEGAAFNFLSNAGGWQRWFFTALSLSVGVVLAVWIKRLGDDKQLLAAGLAFILGGAIGNVIDRIIYGHVIDFIDVYYQNHHFPAFNLADSAINLGVVLLILDMLLEHRKNG